MKGCEIFVKLSECMEAFLNMCEAKNLATRTLADYYSRLTKFYLYLKKENAQLVEDVAMVEETHITNYINSMTEKYSPSTVRGTFVVLKVFFKYALHKNYIMCNPLEYMKAPKLPKVFVHAFSKAEVQEILTSFDRGTFDGYRNYVMMTVLFGTGMRKQELLQLRVDDMLQDDTCIKVCGKGNKERYIPISPILHKILKKYIKKRNSFVAQKGVHDTGALFVTATSGKALTASGFDDVFQKLKQSKKKWATRVSAHTWRHTFAKYYLLNGGNIFSLQHILGHEDISTTKIYLHLNTQEVIEQNNKFNPLDNKRWKFI